MCIKRRLHSKKKLLVYAKAYSLNSSSSNIGKVSVSHELIRGSYSIENVKFTLHLIYEVPVFFIDQFFSQIFFNTWSVNKSLSKRIFTDSSWSKLNLSKSVSLLHKKNGRICWGDPSVKCFRCLNCFVSKLKFAVFLGPIPLSNLRSRCSILCPEPFPWGQPILNILTVDSNEK